MLKVFKTDNFSKLEIVSPIDGYVPKSDDLPFVRAGRNYVLTGDCTSKISNVNTLKFIKNAGSSGLLSTNEAKSLTAIATLAEKGESSAEQPTLSNRNLLIFTAMVDAWRSQLSQKEG